MPTDYQYRNHLKNNIMFMIIKQIEEHIMGINSMALWVITSIHKETISRLWSLKVVIKLCKIIFAASVGNEKMCSHLTPAQV